MTAIARWLQEQPSIRVLGIGGPRESEAPGIYRAALSVLEHALPLGE